jgi:hypothetical protein
MTPGDPAAPRREPAPPATLDLYRDEPASAAAHEGRSVSVLVPCHNEEATVGAVVRGFRSSCPEATVFVYDNASVDNTVSEAADAGAVVRSVPQKGKGNVVRRMFADVDADVYILVDGDDTYDPTVAPELVRLMTEEGYDLVNVTRVSGDEARERRGHATGNRLLTGLVARLFAVPARDMLSGYKALSRRFVRSFPAFSSGFEIETELTVHALDLDMPTTNIAGSYKERPEGSTSKLSTYRDGIRILRTIVNLVRMERPLAFFSTIAAVLAGVAIVLSIPIIVTFVHTHTVPRFPTAILATGLVVLAALSAMTGLILDTVTKGRKEAKRLQYLSIPGPLAPPPRRLGP